MAIGDLGLLGSGAATSAGTTLAVTNTTGATIPIGTTIVVAGTWDNINTTTAPTITCSTIGGATATAGHATPVGSGVTTTAGTGIWHQCFRARTTATIASGGTIATLTSTQQAVKRCAAAEGWSGLTTTLRATVVSATSTAGSPSAVTTGTALVAGDLVIGTVSVENGVIPTGDADSLNGTWDTITGAVATAGVSSANLAVGIQDKEVSATGAQTFNPTGANDAVACVFALVPAPAFVATATLGGDGTLGAVGTPGGSNFTGTATLSGAGTLATSGTPGALGSPGLTGTGTLAAVGVAGGSNFTDTASLSGTGTLSAAGTPKPIGSVALTGAGTLGATGTPRPTGSAILGGTGTLSAATTPKPTGTGSFTGLGTLSATGTPTASGVANLAGSGSLAAASLQQMVGSAELSGLGTLAAVGVVGSGPVDGSSTPVVLPTPGTAPILVTVAAAERSPGTPTATTGQTAVPGRAAGHTTHPVPSTAPADPNAPKTGA